MKTIQYRAIGGYAENTLVEIPPPTPADDQMLISMRTVRTNPIDNAFRSGHHWAATPENLPRVGGQTGVGQVVESRSPPYKVGDRVFVTGPGFGIIVDGTWRTSLAGQRPEVLCRTWPSPVRQGRRQSFL
ncbi:NADPH:quinone reductase-like Zn-dependent oxidoreductase [Paraburkholderia sp. GAS448]